MAVSKPAGAWTYEDLFSLPDDGRRYEIIEGVLYEMPSPTAVRAVVIKNLLFLLDPVIEVLGGWLLTAPLDVFFPGANPVQPDIVVLLPDSPARLSTRGVEGAPDLVVEVLSPTNRAHDLLTKRALYGRAGIREYWIIDPAARTVEVLTFDPRSDTARTPLEESFASPLLGQTELSLARVFARVDEIDG